MRSLRALFLPLLLALACLLPAAQASSSSGLVISQVFAGGGNSGAPYQNDFVELFNRGSSSVDVSGWTLQYASAASTSWSATALSGTIAPGHAYLVQLASTAAVGAVLPAPDATGTANLATTGGKVALVHDAAALTCGDVAGSCSASALVADLVGYGSATDYEGSAAPALSATTALLRAGSGCTDTDANDADFSTAAPAPRNSASAAATCSGGGGGGSSTAGAAVTLDLPAAVSVSLSRASLGFGTAAVGSTPGPLAEAVTVTSTDPAGYVLTAHRSAFSPGDLPLGVAAAAPSGASLGTGLGASALVPVPIAPAADLVVGSKTSVAQAAGDVWPTQLGFTGPLPALAAGHYTATVTFTVIGR